MSTLARILELLGANPGFETLVLRASRRLVELLRYCPVLGSMHHPNPNPPNPNPAPAPAPSPDPVPAPSPAPVQDYPGVPG